MRKWRSFFWVGLLVVVSAFGLTRVKFDTDVLSILPMEMPEVRGLVAFQEMFSKNEELVLLLETDEEGAGTLGSRAAELGALLKEKGLAANVRWQPAWRQEPEALASLVAWLWMNGEPEEVERLAAKLSEENAEATLQQSLEAVATAMDGGQMVLSARDPFGLLGHSSMAAFFQASEHGGAGFESADGKAHRREALLCQHHLLAWAGCAKWRVARLCHPLRQWRASVHPRHQHRHVSRCR